SHRPRASRRDALDELAARLAQPAGAAQVLRALVRRDASLLRSRGPLGPRRGRGQQRRGERGGEEEGTRPHRHSGFHRFLPVAGSMTKGGVHAGLGAEDAGGGLPACAAVVVAPAAGGLRGGAFVPRVDDAGGWAPGPGRSVAFADGTRTAVA